MINSTISLIRLKTEMHKLLPIVISLLLISTLAKAQLPGSSNGATQQGSSQEEPYGFFEIFSGNPGKAALYSLIFPGAGQFYNKRYWKVPLALAAEGTAIFILSNNISEFRKWDQEWKFQVENGFNNPNVTSINNADTVKRIRDNARQQKDYAWVALIGIHIIITAEAFIDRHLIEFDVSDDLSFKLGPFAPTPGLQVVMNF